MADDRGVVHRLDLHWRISNVQFFARAMPAEDLLTRVVSVPALGEHVRVLGSVDALLIACVHRVAHHPANGKLIWLADLRHIGARLTPKDWDVFGSRAHEWCVSAICAAGLTQARQLFAAPVPDDVLTRLERNSRDEPPMARQLVGGRRTALRSLALDLKALPGIRLKARLLFQHAFPTPKFLLRMYSTSRRSPPATPLRAPPRPRRLAMADPPCAVSLTTCNSAVALQTLTRSIPSQRGRGAGARAWRGRTGAVCRACEAGASRSTAAPCLVCRWPRHPGARQHR